VESQLAAAKDVMKVAFVAEGFAPYRVPFWNELARHCDLTVLLLGRLEKGRAWRVNTQAIRCRVEHMDGPQLFLPRMDWALYLSFARVGRALERLQPNVMIVGGWASPGYWAARAWGQRNHVPLVFWSESHQLSTRTRGYFLFDAIKRRFLRVFDAYYAFSPLSAEYLFGFGVDPQHVFLSYNLPDIGAFPRCERMGNSSEPTLLYVGQLILRKGLLPLFDALGRLTQRPWRLLIAGSGPLEPELRKYALHRGFGDRIEFLGYVQQEALNDVYRRGDVLLFPSLNEVWGLVLHEGLLSGTYAVASDRAAASHALLRPEENGEMVSPYDVGALAASIGRALDRIPFDREAIRRTVSHITIEGEVAKLVDAVRFAQARHMRA
jgi:glycosyltransferase involved in cell wall biosynthesis